MRIHLLGSVTIAHDGRSRVLAGSRAGALLATLALSPGRPVSTEYLIDELWPDQTMSNDRNALHATVRRLRKVVDEIADVPGERVVRTESRSYSLDIAPSLIDAHWFTARARRGADLLGLDPVRAAAVLEQALASWPDGISIDLEGGARVRAATEGLEERRLAAYEDLAAARLSEGLGHTVVAELRQQVTAHPERERLVELLMLALYSDGRQTEALDAFHHARAQLIGEHGLELGRALHRTYEAILAHDEELGEPRSARARAAQLIA